jgi:DUF438 domain-containing protein
MLDSVGKFMTIPKGAKMKNISMSDIISALQTNGFEIEEDVPSALSDKKVTQPKYTKNKSNNRTELLKSYLKRLGDGEDIEIVRADFVENFSDVEASEIMQAEQELLKDGTPLSQVQKLCDIHSALFHGATTEEKIANAEKAVEESIRRKKVADEIAKRDSYPKKDYTDKNVKAAELSKISGHPLCTFKKENDALSELLKEFKADRSEETLKKIRELSIHYAKKGDLLYPHLKVKYGISGPSDVMWTVDDEIRNDLSSLCKENPHDTSWNKRLDSVLERVEEMIYKEQNILFPICAVNFTEDEWMQIYRDSKDYDICFNVENSNWKEAEKANAVKIAPKTNSEILMPGGHMTVEQLTALLDTIPLEITFVDSENINRFFNDGHKIFKRPKMAIDREVFSCHPPKIEPMVRSIINDFRSGKKDSVPIWVEKNGETILINYVAVRDKYNNYVGTAEFVQNMEFAKKHFAK